MSKSTEDSIYRDIAIEAAQERGCLGDYKGGLESRLTPSTECPNGGHVMSVLLVRSCGHDNCDAMRIAPFARVTIQCDFSTIVTGMNCQA